MDAFGPHQKAASRTETNLSDKRYPLGGERKRSSLPRRVKVGSAITQSTISRGIPCSGGGQQPPAADIYFVEIHRPSDSTASARTSKWTTSITARGSIQRSASVCVQGSVAVNGRARSRAIALQFYPVSVNETSSLAVNYFRSEIFVNLTIMCRFWIGKTRSLSLLFSLLSKRFISSFE